MDSGLTTVLRKDLVNRNQLSFGCGGEGERAKERGRWATFNFSKKCLIESFPWGQKSGQHEYINNGNEKGRKKTIKISLANACHNGSTSMLTMLNDFSLRLQIKLKSNGQG